LAEKEKTSILVIAWDMWSLWVVIPLLAKQAKAGSKISIITMNFGPNPKKPLHGMEIKGEFKRAFGPTGSEYTSCWEEFSEAFKTLNIHDVRFLDLMPGSRFAGNVQKAMLIITKIIRELKPDIILTQDEKSPHMPGFYSWYCAMVGRAIHEAGSSWHTSHQDIYPIPNPYMQAIEIEHYDLEIHSAKEIYYWGSDYREINFVVDTSDMVDEVTEFTKKGQFFKNWKPLRAVALKRQYGPAVSQYLDVSQNSMYELMGDSQ